MSIAGPTQDGMPYICTQAPTIGHCTRRLGRRRRSHSSGIFMPLRGGPGTYFVIFADRVLFIFGVVIHLIGIFILRVWLIAIVLRLSPSGPSVL